MTTPRTPGIPRHGVPGRRPPLRWPVFLLLLTLLGCGAGLVPDRIGSSAQESPLVGPPSGSLVLAGGGPLGPEIWERFVELAGGTDARIVVIPTAASQDHFPEDWSGLAPLIQAGAEDIQILHTRDRRKADTEAFAAPLAEATGVWIPGGRQWRLVDAYLDTRVHQALFELLERDGVVGGTSAGASILASYLVRGDPETNQVMVSPEYQVGFGLLSKTAVDQHLLARGREDDLWEVLDANPDLLGIGLDEGTALVVRQDHAEVIGVSQALFYDATEPPRYARSFASGAIYDLGTRTPVATAADEDASEEDRDGIQLGTRP